MVQLTYKQLMETNLKGYSYSVRYSGMNMTSRNGGSSECYFVVEDLGETCVVANLYNRDRRYEKLKDEVAKDIAYSPLLDYETGTKNLTYKIVSL